MKITTPQVTTELPPSNDPLAEPLRMLQLTGVLHCRAELTAPWGIDIPRINHSIAIHIVNQGQCWLDVAGQPSLLIEQGSLVMLPHGTRHQIRSQPDVKATPLTDIPVHLITDRYERMSHGGGGARTQISYCGVRFDPIGARKLLQVLPLVIHLKDLATTDTWLNDTANLIAREANATRPGSEAIIASLADVLVIQGIRSWLESESNQNGWLAALKDRQLGQALALMHQDPAHAWTVQSLAQAVGMSRSGFSARFSELVGESVMQYLAEWRMQLARVAILEGSQSMGQIAEDVGYQSEAAFNRAFSRIFGTTPGAYRRTGEI